MSNLAHGGPLSLSLSMYIVILSLSLMSTRSPFLPVSVTMNADTTWSRRRKVTQPVDPIQPHVVQLQPWGPSRGQKRLNYRSRDEGSRRLAPCSMPGCQHSTL
ncbi:hypothetical protein BGZ63DRAFT_387086 [Mariannaea sp. PMI_226]|nr:hypothetical protein BGZ63DRAFT_387086 [Mariannaea sp. PMI_226]